MKLLKIWIRGIHVFLQQYIQCTVKQLIIGDDLFGEIGEFKKFAKINLHQNKNIAVLKYSKVKNRQINSLPNCHI